MALGKENLLSLYLVLFCINGVLKCCLSKQDLIHSSPGSA